MTKKTAIQVKLDPNKAESKFKLLGGGKMDEWNKRLSDITVNALPIAHSKNKDAITEACLAVSYGVMDIAPADPVEGILVAQLMAANEAALAMYQKGWAQPPEYRLCRLLRGRPTKLDRIGLYRRGLTVRKKIDIWTVGIAGALKIMTKSPLKLVAPATVNRTITMRRRPNSVHRTREHLTAVPHPTFP